MLKEYSVSEILGLPSQHIPYFVGTFEDTEDADVEWPHRHDFYSLVWFTQGSGFYVIDMQEYEIVPNRMFLVSPKQIHNWDYSQNSEGYILVCDSTLALELNLNEVTPYLDITDNKSFIEDIFIHLLTETERNDSLTNGNIKAGILYLYSILQRLAKESQVIKPAFDRTISKLKQIIFEDPHCTKIEGYAEKLGISVENLNTICRDNTGVSVKQYILDLKVTEAKRLLIYTSNNINEIAFSLGFEDSSYFSRIFRKRTSLSPSDFLQKYRKHK